MITTRPGSDAGPGMVNLDRGAWKPRLVTLTIALVMALAAAMAALAAAKQPQLALGLVATGCIFVLAFRMPVANLTILLFLTAIVPYDVLNRFSIAGATNSPGLLPSDVFLLAGLTWAVLAIPQMTARPAQALVLPGDAGIPRR